jgi:hypothetical protein
MPKQGNPTKKPQIKTPGAINGADSKNAPDILNKLLWPVFIIYVTAVIYGVINHEPWRDEAQSWLVARDNSLIGLFRLLPSEGHPPLWYLILMPIAKAGVSYAVLNWLSAAIMIASVYLLLFKTSIPDLVKLLLPFSYVFFYEYSVLSRNYCLMVFFVMAILSLYHKRFDKPVLFALCVVGLFNSHVLAFGLAFALLVVYIIDAIQLKKLNRKTSAAIAIICLGGLYLVPYMAMNRASGMFEGMITDHAKLVNNAIIGAILIDGNSLVAWILLLAITILILTKTKPFMVFIIGSLCALYILGYKYNLGDTRHFGVLLVIALAAFGLYNEYKDEPTGIFKAPNIDLAKYVSWLFALIIVLQSSKTFGSYKDDIEQEFSGAKTAAEYIKENNLQDHILVGQQAWAVSAIVPYLSKDVKVYYAECQRYGSYYIYDSCFLQNKWYSAPENAVDIAYNNFKDSLGDVIFIFNSPLSERSEQFMDLLYHSPEQPIKKDEAFYIYKFKPVEKQ